MTASHPSVYKLSFTYVCLLLKEILSFLSLVVPLFVFRMAFVSGVALTRTCWDGIGLVFLAAVAGVCTVGFLFQTPALKQTAQDDKHIHMDKPAIVL